MRKILSSLVIITILFSLSSCSFLSGTSQENENSVTNEPADSTSDPTMPDISTPLPPEKTEVEVTEVQILKYYDYFANVAPGFVQISYAMGGDFTELSFGSAAEVSDGGMIMYALENLSQKGLYETDEDGYTCWKTDDVIREIERGFAREVTGFEASGLVNEISKDGILKSTGWDTGEGFSAKLIQLTQWPDGTYTGVFDFYGASDYLLEVGPFDIREEIVKEDSEILNSKYCVNTRKTITFIEKQDDNGFHLQFVSME